MTLLVLNSGSSSLKYALYDVQTLEMLYSATIEHIAEINSEIKNHIEAIDSMFTTLKIEGFLADMSTLFGVGHRVVHGGHYFSDGVIVDDEVICKIRECIPLAPLHNGANLDGILAIKTRVPKVKQVAIFDTAFHQSMPQKAFMYALPYDLYEKEHIRRYGFHGTSHAYVMKVAAKHLGIKLEAFNAISFHLGNGASVCAIKAGKSVDTSMGFSPLEGLIMGSRSGDVDGEIIIYLQEKMGMSYEAVSQLLNKKSGLLGIAKVNDMREILQRKEQGDALATLAFEMFVYRIRKYLGAYAVALGRVDTLIFTGGIGEHAFEVREAVVSGLDALLGLKIDSKKNSAIKQFPQIVSDSKSRISICVVATDEARAIAQESKQLLFSSTLKY